MEDQSDSSPQPTTPANVTATSTSQFGVSALFWVTFMVGLAIAFLQQSGDPQVLTGAAFSLLAVMLVSVVIGVVARQTLEALFWGTLVGAFGYLSLVSDPVFSPDHRFTWAMIGGVSGAGAAVWYQENWGLNIAFAALAAGLAIGVYWLMSTTVSADLRFDLFAAPLIGAAVAVFVRLIKWLEVGNRMPRYVTATWLLLVVILGNLVSQWMR